MEISPFNHKKSEEPLSSKNGRKRMFKNKIQRIHLFRENNFIKKNDSQPDIVELID